MKKKVKKNLCYMITAAIITCTVAIPSNTVFAKYVPEMSDVAREAVSEGIVMLKNDDNVLPISQDKTLSVFGRVQVDTFNSGYGSGGGTWAAYQVSILQGLKKKTGLKLNENLVKTYETWCAENPKNDGSWGNWPYYYPEMPLSQSQVREAKNQSDVAAIVVGRAAGEDRECKLEKGSYYLTDAETDMISKVCAEFENVVILLNIGNIMDMSWIADYPSIKSVLCVWQGGMETGNGIADVIAGDVSPSGKLSSTVAKSYKDYPSSDNFGNLYSNNYSEDIYVGYRYFETFEKDSVLYPFGYGLSYTDFTITPTIKINDGRIEVSADVKNIGTYAGKEVVQVYYSAPQGKLGKPAKQLAAYAKTDTIAPGGTQTINIAFDVSKMASYDDTGITGNKSAWVLEAGDYNIYVGNSVRSEEIAGTYKLKELQVTEQLEEANPITQSGFQRIKPVAENGKFKKTTEIVPLASRNLAQRVKDNLPKAIEMTGDKGIKLIDVYHEKKHDG